MKRRPTFFCVGALLAMAASCVQYKGQKDPLVGAPNDYLGASVFAATGAAAAVVHRKVTGGCLAQCLDGTVCNSESGLCEKVECPCPAGQRCSRQGAVKRCVDGGSRQPATRSEPLGWPEPRDAEDYESQPDAGRSVVDGGE